MALQEAPPLDVIAAIATTVPAGVVVPPARQFSGSTQATEPSEEIAGGLKEMGAKENAPRTPEVATITHSPVHDCDVKTSGPALAEAWTEKEVDPLPWLFV